MKRVPFKVGDKVSIFKKDGLKYTLMPILAIEIVSVIGNKAFTNNWDWPVFNSLTGIGYCNCLIKHWIPEYDDRIHRVHVIAAQRQAERYTSEMSTLSLELVTKITRKAADCELSDETCISIMAMLGD